MKFKIQVEDANGNQWWESYDEKTDDPKAWAEQIINSFNASLRPWETERKLINIETVDDSNSRFHSWVKRTDGMSVEFRGSVCDLMRCEKCGITGKRFGYNKTVKIDSKYKKKAFQRCDTAIEELKKGRP